MKEKYINYLYLNNNKNLIGTQLPKESDLKKFATWSKKVRNSMFKMIVISSIIVMLIYGVLFATGVFLEAGLKEKLFGILCLFIFGYIEQFLIKQYLKAKCWKMEYCNYGKVIDKYYMSKGRSRDYYIVVKVGDNVLKFDKYTIYEYHKLDVNDDVIVFSIDGHDNAYVTKMLNN